jgi:transposase-like protein
MSRQLPDLFPYLIVDAHYENVRVDHVILDWAVMIGIGTGWDGRLQVSPETTNAPLTT